MTRALGTPDVRSSLFLRTMAALALFCGSLLLAHRPCSGEEEAAGDSTLELGLPVPASERRSDDGRIHLAAVLGRRTWARGLRALRVSHAGHLVAAFADLPGSVVVLDARTGRPLRLLSMPGSTPLSLAFSGTDDSLFIGTSDGSLHRWDMEGAPTPVTRLPSEERIVRLLTRQGVPLVVCHTDAGCLHAVQVEDGSIAWSRSMMGAVATAADWIGGREQPRLVCTAGPQLVLLDALRGGELRTYPAADSGPLESVIVSLETGAVAARTCLGDVVLRQDAVSHPTIRRRLRASAMAFHPSGKTLLVAERGDEGRLVVLDARSLESASRGAGPSVVGFQSSGSRVLAETRNGGMQAARWGADPTRVPEPEPTGVASKTITRFDADFLAAPASDHGLLLVPIPRGEKRTFCRIARVAVAGAVLAFGTFDCDDGPCLVVSTSAGVTCHRRARDGWTARRIHGGEEVSVVAQGPPGASVILGTVAGTLRVLTSLDGSEIIERTRHRGQVSVVAVRSDGRSFLTGGFDRVARLWRAEGLRMLKESPGLRGSIRAATWLGSAGLWAVGCGGGSVQFLDSEDLEVRHWIQAHTGPVVGMGTVGGALVTIGRDRDLKVWSCTSRELVTFLRIPFEPTAMDVDGRVVTVLGAQGQINQFRIDARDI